MKKSQGHAVCYTLLKAGNLFRLPAYMPLFMKWAVA